MRKKLRQLSNQKHRQPNNAINIVKNSNNMKLHSEKKREQNIQNQLRTTAESVTLTVSGRTESLAEKTS